MLAVGCAALAVVSLAARAGWADTPAAEAPSGSGSAAAGPGDTAPEPSPADRMAALVSACKTNNDNAACVAAGTAILCEKGALHECHRSPAVRSLAARTELLRRAAEVFALACQRDDPASCSGLAHVADLANPRDLPRARALWTKACERKHGPACYRLGELAQNESKAAKPELLKAAALFRDACDHKVWPACVLWAALLEGPLRTDAPARVGEAIQQACSGGSPAGCTYLGFLALEGRAGIAADEALAKASFQTACDGGALIACGCVKNLAQCRAPSASAQKEEAGVGVPCAQQFQKNLPTLRITARDLRHAWILLIEGKMPGPTGALKGGYLDQGTPPEREVLIRQLALQMRALKVYDWKEEHQGAHPLRPGDLLVFSLPWHEMGSVVLVRGTLREPMMSFPATIYREKDGTFSDWEDFPLTLSFKRNKRYVRPGLLWLRPTAEALCAGDSPQAPK